PPGTGLRPTPPGRVSSLGARWRESGPFDSTLAPGESADRAGRAGKHSAVHTLTTAAAKPGERRRRRARPAAAKDNSTAPAARAKPRLDSRAPGDRPVWPL